MAAREGVRRVRAVGGWALGIGLIFPAIELLSEAGRHSRGLQPEYLGFGEPGYFLIAADGMIMLAAWILGGFFARANRPKPDPPKSAVR